MQICDKTYKWLNCFFMCQTFFLSRIESLRRKNSRVNFIYTKLNSVYLSRT